MGNDKSSMLVCCSRCHFAALHQCREEWSICGKGDYASPFSYILKNNNKLNKNASLYDAFVRHVTMLTHHNIHHYAMHFLCMSLSTTFISYYDLMLLIFFLYIAKIRFEVNFRQFRPINLSFNGASTM